MLISAIHQHESAIGIHISPPSWTFLPSPTPFHPSRMLQSTSLSPLCHTADSHWLSILHMVIYNIHATLSVHPSLSFPHSVHKLLLYVSVSTAALQIGSSVLIFLDSIYVHIYMIFPNQKFWGRSYSTSLPFFFLEARVSYVKIDQK